jgi:hypothetical protein
MLIRKKHILFTLGGALLLLILALFDIHRQQKLAENYAGKNLNKIISAGTTLRKWGLPNALLNIDIKRVDTNFTFSQWEVIFATEDNGFVQVFVEPSNVVGVPILNFKDDFSINYVSYEK